MKSIIFKVKDNKLNIFVDETISNRDFLLQLKERLQRLIVVKETLAKNVILNIENRRLDNREVLELFDILNDFDGFYISKINCKKMGKEGITIYKGNLRGGQIRFFPKSLILIGLINKGSKVIVNGDLFVLGKIYGDVELKDKESRIYCESISGSLVKIGDINKLYDKELTSKEIYFESNEIKERDYKKGEMLNVKSNSCYIR